MDLTREQVLAYRFAAQQLVRPATSTADDAAVSHSTMLDLAVLALGVQNTGADAGRWALCNRGVHPSRLESTPDDLILLWTLRGAPHFYRRDDVAAVAAATSPFSEADAAKRVFDAAKPLREAGIPVLEALDVIAEQMRDIVRRPMSKGEVSTLLSSRLSAPYLRFCRPCAATHLFEQPFRLAAVRAGLELRPDTSPPVLERIPGWSGPIGPEADDEGEPALDVVRAYLRLLGPATPAMVAGYLDAPLVDVRRRWPEDAVEVSVAGERRWLLPDDLSALSDAADPPRTAPVLRLLGPFDLFLQARDRALIIPDPGRRKQMWVVLGRPGAVVRDGEVLGTWRPRATRGALKLLVEEWLPVPADELAVEGERLAALRGVTFAGLARA